MSLDQEELDELLASLELPVPGMVAGSHLHEPQGVPASVAGETGLAKLPTSGHSNRLQLPSDASLQESPSSRIPSLSSSSSLSSQRIQLPSIGSRPGSGSAPTAPLAMSSSEATTDVDALTASLESEGVIPADPQAPVSARERDMGSNRVSGSEVKFTALPPLLSTSPKSQSMSKVAFEASSGTDQEHAHHEGHATILEKQSTEVHFKGVDFKSMNSPRASSSQSPRATPGGVTPLGKTISPSRRRLTLGSHEISPHALERLGVNTDILKKEKGMKKLGISDVDIQRSEEIRRYSGVPQHLSPATKVEFMFGFTKEQLLRSKAMDRLGTSEEEVMDEYSRRVSRLGEVHEPPALHIK